MKKQIFYVATAAALLALGSCTDRSREFDACGQIEATEVLVSAEANGRIIALQVTEGDKLTAGEVVGVIDSVQTYLQKEELVRKRSNTQTKWVDIDRQLASQYAQLNKLKSDRERYQALEAKDAATRKQVDDLVSQIAVTEREIAAQRQNYERNNAGIREELALYDVQIAEKDDLKQVYVRAYLTTAQLAEVKLGDTVQVTIEDGTDKPRTYEGRLVWIADEAEFTPKNIQTKDERADLVYAAKIALDNDGYLKLGMYAYVRFQ